jgi:hypothetical protein
VKFKSLAVITLFVFVLGLSGSVAFAQAPGSYSFWDAAGTFEYCNYNVITEAFSGVVAGYDDTVNDCFFEYNSPIVGFNATTPNDGAPAHGKGAVVGDGIYDASCICYSGLQWTVWQSDKTSKKNKKTGIYTGAYGWIGLAGSYTGTYFGDNYGYLGAGAPAKSEVAGHRTIAGPTRNLIKKN